MRIGVVIPVGRGRDENLMAVLTCLSAQTRMPAAVCIVEDGEALDGELVLSQGQTEWWSEHLMRVRVPKHEPGREQPRNVGVRYLQEQHGSLTHVWFLDSDVVVEPDCLELIEEALEDGPQDRILVLPYDWLPAGQRPAPGEDFPLEYHEMRNDPRWVSFDQYGSDETITEDLAAGLACFSGNLVWPIGEFERVGGFWSEIHHGRCEDGELGLRAVSMGVGIGFARGARGWHLAHPVNTEIAIARNHRDVPMLNARHPWVQGSGVFLVDRDGKAFDVECRSCGKRIPTIGWWEHADECGIVPRIPVVRDEMAP